MDSPENLANEVECIPLRDRFDFRALAQDAAMPDNPLRPETKRPRRTSVRRGRFVEASPAGPLPPGTISPEPEAAEVNDAAPSWAGRSGGRGRPAICGGPSRSIVGPIDMG